MSRNRKIEAFKRLRTRAASTIIEDSESEYNPDPEKKVQKPLTEQRLKKKLLHKLVEVAADT